MSLRVRWWRWSADGACSFSGADPKETLEEEAGRVADTLRCIGEFGTEFSPLWFELGVKLAVFVSGVGFDATLVVTEPGDAEGDNGVWFFLGGNKLIKDSLLFEEGIDEGFLRRSRSADGVEGTAEGASSFGMESGRDGECGTGVETVVGSEVASSAAAESACPDGDLSCVSVHNSFGFTEFQLGKSGDVWSVA